MFFCGKHISLTQTLQTPCAIVGHGIALGYLRGVDPTEAASARESGLFALWIPGLEIEVIRPRDIADRRRGDYSRRWTPTCRRLSLPSRWRRLALPGLHRLARPGCAAAHGKRSAPTTSELTRYAPSASARASRVQLRSWTTLSRSGGAELTRRATTRDCAATATRGRPLTRGENGWGRGGVNLWG
mgnify:CR=1 FL=1